MIRESEVLSLYISTTEVCQLKCPGCSVGIDRRVEGLDGVVVEELDEERDWTVNGLLKALRSEIELAKKKGKEFYLKIKWAGGEPLLRWELIEEIQPGLEVLAKEYGIKVEQVILTNGLLLNKRADDIADLAEKTRSWSFWNVAVSLWGWGEENFIKRGRPDIKAGFKLIKQGLRKLYERGVSFNLQHTFGPWGEEYDLVEFVRHLWDVEAEDYLGRDDEGRFWYVDEEGEPMPFRLSLAFWRKQEGFLTGKEALRMWIQAKRLLDWLEEKVIVEGRRIRSSFTRMFTYLILRDYVHGTCGSGTVYWAIEPAGNDYRRVRCHEGLYGRNPELFVDLSEAILFRDGPSKEDEKMGKKDPITNIFPESIPFNLAFSLGGRGCPNTWMRISSDEETKAGYEKWAKKVKEFLQERGLWKEEWEKEFRPPLPITMIYSNLIPRILLLSYVNGDAVDGLVRQTFFPEFEKEDFESVSWIYKEILRTVWAWRWSSSRSDMEEVLPSNKWWSDLRKAISGLSRREKKTLLSLLNWRGSFVKDIWEEDLSGKEFVELLIRYAELEEEVADSFVDKMKMVFNESRSNPIASLCGRFVDWVSLSRMARRAGVQWNTGLLVDWRDKAEELTRELREYKWRFFFRDRALLSLATVFSFWLMWLSYERYHEPMITAPTVVWGLIGLLLIFLEIDDYRDVIEPFQLDGLVAEKVGGKEAKVRVNDVLEAISLQTLYGERGDPQAILWKFVFLVSSLRWGGVEWGLALTPGILALLSFLFDRPLSMWLGGQDRIEEWEKGYWRRFGNIIERRLLAWKVDFVKPDENSEDIRELGELSFWEFLREYLGLAKKD